MIPIFATVPVATVLGGDPDRGFLIADIRPHHTAGNTISTAPRHYRLFGLEEVYRTSTYPAFYNVWGSTVAGTNGTPAASAWTAGTASANSLYGAPATYQASNALPGNSGMWVPAQTADYGKNDWWANDLGSGNTARIRSIGIEVYTSVSQAQIWSKFAVQCSLDGTNWDTISVFKPKDAGGDSTEDNTPNYSFNLPDHGYDANGDFVLKGLFDYSPYGWTVTENGAGAWSYDTDKATADGTNYLTVDVDPALLQPNDISQMTVEISCSLGTATTYQWLVHAGAGTGHAWCLSASGGGSGVLDFYRNNNGATRAAGGSISNGVRFDAKLLIDKTAGLILDDNEPASSASFYSGSFGTQTIDNLYIGHGAGPGTSPLTSGSEIYRVRIYRGILKHDIAVPTAPFVSDANTECLVSFDGSDGATSATDQSSNSHTLSFASGFELDTAEKQFGTASLLCPSTGTGVSYTRSAAKNTSDFTNECFYKANDLSYNYASLGGDGLYQGVNSYTWYRYGGAPANWENNASKGVGLPAFTDQGFRHHVWQRQNNIMLHWAGGKLVHFYSQTASLTSTTARIGGNNTSIGGSGWVDEWRDSTVARYTPTLMRDETAYDTPSAESGANWFAADFYTGNGGTLSRSFTDFDPSAGCLTAIKVTSNPYSNYWWDTERGATKLIHPDATNAEQTVSGVTSFDADGFTVGGNVGTNGSGSKYKANVLRADLSESITVDSQSLTLKHSGKGFAEIEIDRALGGASGMITIDISAMGLISAPMVVVKNLDSAQSWIVYHPGLPSGQYLLLNSSNAATGTLSVQQFGNNSTDVPPTATTITLGYNRDVGGDNSSAGADRIIVYVFGEVSADDSENYIKLLDFAHTSGQASYAECGWQPAWSVCKMRDVGGTDWVSRQTKRGTGLATLLNGATAEATDFGAHGPFGVELNGTYAATGNIIGFAVRGN